LEEMLLARCLNTYFLRVNACRKIENSTGSAAGFITLARFVDKGLNV